MFTKFRILVVCQNATWGLRGRRTLWRLKWTGHEFLCSICYLYNSPTESTEALWIMYYSAWLTHECLISDIKCHKNTPGKLQKKLVLRFVFITTKFKRIKLDPPIFKVFLLIKYYETVKPTPYWASELQSRHKIRIFFKFFQEIWVSSFFNLRHINTYFLIFNESSRLY
jgi:hypothetical protein